MLNSKFRLLTVLSTAGLLLIALIVFTPAPVHAATNCATADVSQAECEALVALYNSTGGDNWGDNTNWLQDQTVCGWHGVTCTGNAVTTLNLGSNNLIGSVPVEIGDLSSLTLLYLNSNQLTALPAEIGNLFSLQTLDLYNNQLTALPAEIGNLSSLIGLSLYRNQLAALPAAIGNLSSLQTVYLSFNQLTALPAEIGNLSSLNNLFLHDNQLTDLPLTITSLASLNNFTINYNALPISGLDAALEAFLDAKAESDWQTTQTVPPDAVMVGATTATSVDLSWTPVGDTTSAGYYEVGVSTTDGGPYTFDPANRTVDKSATGITVSNLTSGTTYYLVVRAFREALPDDYAALTSINSAQVSATPTEAPTEVPTEIPTTVATEAPTEVPTQTATETPTEVPGTELLVNGGFEEIDGSGKPDLLPWIVKNSTKDKIKCNNETKTFAYDGDCAFAFKGGPGEASALQQSAVVSSLPAAVGDEIVFNQYVQATNAAASGKYKVVLKYSDAPTAKITGNITTAADYTLLSGSFTLASANITKVKLQIRHTSPAGKVYLDAVSLTLNPAGAAGLGSRAIPLP